MKSQKKEKWNNLIMELMEQYKILGLSVCIVEKGEIIFERGFGLRQINPAKKMTENTLIGIGSISKSFTALAILQLEQQGLLSIEDPINKYFPFFPQKESNEIKIKHLLSHSTGFPSLDGTIISMLQSDDRYLTYLPIQTRQDLEWYIAQAKEECQFPPGTRFFYNNDMFTLLGYLIEDLSGLSYTEYIQKHIFGPLKMERTCHYQSDLDEDYAIGYYQKKGSSIPEPGKFPFHEFLNAPGGIITSAHEMKNYMIAMLNKGKFENQTVINPDLFSKLWDPQISCPYHLSKKTDYCLGWVRENNFYNNLLILHGGGLSVITAFLGLLPEKEFGVFVVENDSKGLSGIIAHAILADFLEKDPEEVVPLFQLNQWKKRICGKYQTFRGLYKAEVSLKNTELFINLEIDDGKLEFTLIPKDLENLTFSTPSLIPEFSRTFQFSENPETKKMKYFIYDRYLYHRID